MVYVFAKTEDPGCCLIYLVALLVDLFLASKCAGDEFARIRWKL